MSGMVMAKDQKNIFKCGASVAPVTDWIYYGRRLNLNSYRNKFLKILEFFKYLHKAYFCIFHLARPKSY